MKKMENIDRAKIKPTLVIPFERKDGLPYIKFQIGGKVCEFLVNTGCRCCKIDEKFYYEIGGQNSMLIGSKTLVEVTMSGHIFKMLVVIEPLNSADYSGIIGVNFLHRFKMNVDFALEFMYTYKDIE